MHLGRLAGAALLGAWPACAAAQSVKLDGMVQHEISFTVDQLRALPPTQVDVSFQTMHGIDHHAWTGVALWDLVGKAGLKDEPGKRTGMRHVLLVRGQDGYAAALAIGEIDPGQEGKKIILAYRQDGAASDLPGLRLIVPQDRHGARDVRDVVEIEIR